MKKIYLTYRTIGVQILCGILMYILTWTIFENRSLSKEMQSNILGYILTINSIFSAVLLTYLFSRLAWVKQRRLDYSIEAIGFSQKITNYRRILHVFITKDRLWQSPINTTRLFDSGRYQYLDFCDYRMSHIGVSYISPNAQLIAQLDNDANYGGENSRLYLAMASMIEDRTAPRILANFPSELYDDYDYKYVYDFDMIANWVNCDIASLIGGWVVNNNNYIQYHNLQPDERNLITDACSRINPKYRGRAFTPQLLKDVSDEIHEFHLPQLYNLLYRLQQRLDAINKILTILICSSFTIGVIFPLLLLISDAESNMVAYLVKLLTALNIGIFSFFLIKFPFLIIREHGEV